MRPQQQYYMIFNGKLIFFFQFLINLPCYSMGILHFSQFSSIFHINQWETYIFLLFHKFSILFNGKFAFCQFPMLFNGNIRFEKLQGGMYGQTDVLQDIHSLGPLPKKEAEFSPQRNRLCCVVTIQSECQIEQQTRNRQEG